MDFYIFYGTFEKKINVTEICLIHLLDKKIITIPMGDLNRSKYFGDPVPNVLKYIYVVFFNGNNKNNNKDTNVYEDKLEIKIYLDTKCIVTKYDPIHYKLIQIQNTLNLQYGTFDEELPEQKMVVSYIKGDEKVLEIGGNIGRNSLVIGSILAKKGNNHFVTLESNTIISEQLRENRNNNGLQFFIENSALSQRKLIQRGWNTIVSDEFLQGYDPVQIISWQNLKDKYEIEFDTLVLDCEGAFYYILMDMPEILDNIKLIIMENDYWDLSHKEAIDQVLFEKGFKVDYSEAGGWGPCEDRFYEVFVKV